MSKGELFNKINRNSLKRVLGISVCLLSIFISLNHGYVSGFLFWCIAFIFGSIYTYIICIILFLFGLSYIVQKRITFHNIKFIIIGLILVLIGSLIAITNSLTTVDGVSLTFSNFSETFINSLSLNEFPIINWNSCGIIGYILVALLNSAMTSVGSIVFSTILIVLGVIFILLRPIYYLFKTIKIDNKSVNKNSEVINEYKEESNLISEEYGFTNPLTRDGPNNDYLDKEEVKEQVILKEEPKIEISETKKSEVKVTNDIIDERPYFNTNSFKNNSLEKVKLNLSDDDKKVSSNNIAHSYQSNLNNYPNTYEEVKNEYIKETESTPKQNVSENNFVNNTNVNNKNENNLSYSFSQSENKQNEEKVITDHPISNTNNSPAFSKTQVISKSIEPKKTINLNQVNSLKKPAEHASNAPYMEVPLDILDDRTSENEDKENILVCEERKAKINSILNDLGVKARIVSYKIGPSVTRFDLETDKNVSVNGIEKYMNDISIRLGGLVARFVPIVLGKSTSGIEIANAARSIVNFKDVYEHLPPRKLDELYIPFGKNISGDYMQANLLDFPHMLVCGTTGSGKSIFMHSVILSIIMRYAPSEVRLCMVDPKRVEFSKYKDEPHLLCPIISDPNLAYATTTKLVDEMENRFTSFELAGVSNIKQYNKYARETGLEPIPYIVLIIDEFADLVESVKTIIQPVQRLGQKARAAGIHMIIATQRPSTDVLPGTVKANLAVRVALMTSSPVDSNVILGEGGAEKLLGNGDMLVMCQLISKAEKPRVQGCFVDNSEIRRVVDLLKSRYELEYNKDFVGLLDKAKADENTIGILHDSNSEDDERYEEIKEYVMETKEYCSISMIQREFKFGYGRSQRMFNRLIEEGIIEKPPTNNNSKGAKVLIHTKDFNDPNNQTVHPGSYSQSSFESNNENS